MRTAGRWLSVPERGFAGAVVGLFDRGYRRSDWKLLTLDNGLALPAAPAIYDLPLPLLAQLASSIGRVLAPEIAAARLIKRLQSAARFRWPLQNGMVRAGGSDWLIAVLPRSRVHDAASAYPVRAIVYRWSGTRWAVRGRVTRLPRAMNLEWFGGWFVASSAAGSDAVAFTIAGSDSRTTATITNAGGHWHVG